MFSKYPNKNTIFIKRFIIVLSVFLSIMSQSVFANNSVENLEIIPKDAISKPIYRIWSGKNFSYKIYNEETQQIEKYISEDGLTFQNTGLSPEIANKWVMVWMKDKYIAFEYGKDVPDNHFDERGYTSPLYLLDENFNVIKSVEYPGRIIEYAYKDGIFYYVTQERVHYRLYIEGAYKSDFNFTYHKTTDFEHIESINGNYLMKYEVMPVYETALEEKGVVYEKKYGNPFEGTNFYYTHDKGLYSLDGVYFLKFPVEGVSTGRNAWYYEGHLYVEEEDKYYKLKVDWPEYTYVELNGTLLGFEYPPVTENDRTLVPMRFLFEQMGDTVTWDEETMTATASNRENTIVFGIDNVNATVNGEAEIMDVPARLINDKTYVPLRFLSENLGYTVLWDDATNTATILTDPTKYTEPTDIRCSINGIMVDSFAIAGNQYIPLYMLPNYGFTVTQNGDDRFLERSSKTDFAGVSARNDINQDYFPVSENKNPVYINGKLTNTYKVNGGIVIQADELLEFGTAAFNPETRVFEIKVIY